MGDVSGEWDASMPARAIVYQGADTGKAFAAARQDASPNTAGPSTWGTPHRMEQEILSAISNLAGRVAMVETLNTHMLAHICAQVDDPVPLALKILDDVQETLIQQHAIASGENRRVMSSALARFHEMRDVMSAVVGKMNGIEH